MKWRNYYPDNHCYFITSTVNGRIPLLTEPAIASIFAKHVDKSRAIFDFKLYAYVIMPDHWHVLLYFDRGLDCLAFNRDFKRFSSTDIIKYLRQSGNVDLLNAFHRYANGKVQYSFWKEQARVIPIYTPKRLEKKIEYIHMNPVKRGLVDYPDNYLFSSAKYYFTGQKGPLEIDRIESIFFT